jgi:hypothetical protein
MGAAKTGKRWSKITARKCETCGTEFTPRRDSARYCSSKCYGASRVGSPSYNYVGRRVDQRNGYVYIHCPTHPLATSNGYVAEHRLVACQKLGRLLAKNEVVHHIDRNGGNNHPDNLAVMTQAEHAALHKAEGW